MLVVVHQLLEALALLDDLLQNLCRLPILCRHWNLMLSSLFVVWLAQLLELFDLTHG